MIKREMHIDVATWNVNRDNIGLAIVVPKSSFYVNLHRYIVRKIDILLVKEHKLSIAHAYH